MDLRNLSLLTRLTLIMTAAITVLLGAAAIGLSAFLEGRLETRAMASLVSANGQIIDSLSSYSRALKSEAKHLNQIFASNLSEHIQEDGRGQRRRLAGLDESAFRADVAAQAAKLGLLGEVEANVLVRRADRFEPLTAANGIVAGAVLDRAHGAYAAVMRGEPYVGLIRDSRHSVMAYFQPVMADSAEVTDVLVTAVDFSSGFEELRKRILGVKVGESGYPYALSLGDSAGVLTLHPKIEGQSMASVKGAHGEDFINEMLTKKEGLVRYWWQNVGDTTPREKIAAYAHYPEWDWVIVSGSYLDEFNAEGREVVQMLAASTALLLMVIVGVLWWALRRWVANPLEAVGEVAHAIASGDFSRSITTGRFDEIGRLLVSFATMQEGLRALLMQLQQAASEVTGSTTQLKAASSGVARSSYGQSGALSGMAASVEEMSRSIEHIAESAQQAEDVAVKSLDRAKASTQIIDTAALAMGKIADAVRETESTVTHLERQSSSISLITGTIKEIAEQTRLLALNAAIEAARAGEHGRGFAVVADEVRKLSERTAQSTQEIATLVEAIQRGTREAAAKMDHGVAEVTRGVELASEANASISQIREGANEVRAVVAEITQAIREQSIASHTVAGAVEQIAEQVENNSGEAERTAREAEQLQALAEGLRKLVSRFRF